MDAFNPHHLTRSSLTVPYILVQGEANLGLVRYNTMYIEKGIGELTSNGEAVLTMRLRWTLSVDRPRPSVDVSQRALRLCCESFATHFISHVAFPIHRLIYLWLKSILVFFFFAVDMKNPSHKLQAKTNASYNTNTSQYETIRQSV